MEGVTGGGGGRPALSCLFSHTHAAPHHHLPLTAPRTEADVRAHFARLGQQQQQQEREPADDDDHPDFARWVPGLPLSRTAPPPGGRPRARIVAFPCAGSAEDMYSAEGTGERRAASPLLVRGSGEMEGERGAHLPTSSPSPQPLRIFFSILLSLSLSLSSFSRTGAGPTPSSCWPSSRPAGARAGGRPPSPAPRP